MSVTPHPINGTSLFGIPMFTPPILERRADTWLRIQDTTSKLCWDTNTVAAGARVSYQTCNPISSTQNFLSKTVTGGSLLSVKVDNTHSFCLTLATDGYLTLSACATSAPNQVVAISTANAISINSKCLGPSKDGFLASYPCTTKRPITKVAGTAPSYVMVPQVSQMITESGLCVDSSYTTAVKAVACSSSASQLWYWAFGQIRSVQSGLCLDSPNAWDGIAPSDITATLQMIRCNSYPPSTTQLWIRNYDASLMNGASANCIYQIAQSDGSELLTLGTNSCGAVGTDSLAGRPHSFLGLDTFILDLGDAYAACPNGDEFARQDFRDLTAAKQQQFFNGLNLLQKVPSMMGRRSIYQDIVALHGAAAGWVHGSPQFLPWHRYFIAVLEAQLRTVLKDPTFVHPYWDWSSNPSNWGLTSTGILTSTRFGTDGQGTNSCVNDGFMNKQFWIPTDSACLARSYDVKTDAFYDEAYMMLITQVDTNGNAYANYDAFRQTLEGGPHNNFHVVIGGTKASSASQMSYPATSVNDPIFWQHHINIDRFYRYWQLVNPNFAISYDGKEVLMRRGRKGKGSSSGGSKGKNGKPKKKLRGHKVSIEIPEGAHRYITKFQDAVHRSHDQTSKRTKGKGGKKTHPKADHSSNPDYQCDSRRHFTPVTEQFLASMNMLDKLGEMRALENRARGLTQQIWQETDNVLKELLGVSDYSKAGYEEHAVAVHVAVGKVVDDCIGEE
ncbi:hypothetical protein HDU76_003017 [Blyttiomyces sp. JEL0837]|nr:hypothetical protein HDU76_003017 [Blyttiomyces sp. JEL0837]